VTRQAQERIVGLIGTGADQGAPITVDGRGYKVPGFEDGFFVGPTVIDNVTPTMNVYREEVFGPVLSVVRVDDVDEAFRLVNSNPLGNGTAIFTNSGEAARRFQRGVNVGMIGFDVPGASADGLYSFGGWKDSLSVISTSMDRRECRFTPAARSLRPTGHTSTTRVTLASTIRPLSEPAIRGCPGSALSTVREARTPLLDDCDVTH
jgi:hypothetical protein